MELGVDIPKMYYPEVNQSHFDELLRFEILPNVNVPVLLLIATGSRRGKFTTQLKIKEVMDNEGYKTGLISSEPHGELFGASYVLPTGHMRNVDVFVNVFTALIRLLTRAVSYYVKPDLIVMGTQGAFIPHNPLTSLPQMGILENIGYVYGALPDMIVCSIDPYDEVEYIKRTVEATKIYCNAEIAFYAITPFHVGEGTDRAHLSPGKLNQRIAYYELELGRPVIDVLSERAKETILSCITDICS